MIPSMFSLDHRLTELRPSERDQETARRLRDAASATRRIVRVGASAASRNTIRITGQPARLTAG